MTLLFKEVQSGLILNYGPLQHQGSGLTKEIISNKLKANQTYFLIVQVWISFESYTSHKRKFSKFYFIFLFMSNLIFIFKYSRQKLNVEKYLTTCS